MTRWSLRVGRLKRSSAAIAQTKRAFQNLIPAPRKERFDMLQLFAKWLRLVPFPRSVRQILLGLLLVAGLSACATATAPTTPTDALLRSCLVPVTGSPEIDAPALEHALEECDSQIAGLRAWRDSIREKRGLGVGKGGGV
mgnify:CR=1 FL=1